MVAVAYGGSICTGNSYCKSGSYNWCIFPYQSGYTTWFITKAAGTVYI